MMLYDPFSVLLRSLKVKSAMALYKKCTSPLCHDFMTKCTIFLVSAAILFSGYFQVFCMEFG